MVSLLELDKIDKLEFIYKRHNKPGLTLYSSFPSSKLNQIHMSNTQIDTKIQ